MDWNKHKRRWALGVGLCLAVVCAVSCTVSYGFTGASINYNEIKTIQIDNVPIRSPYVWAPMEAMFNNALQDQFVNQTQLSLVKRNGDLHISGEIVAYDQYNKSISADGYSAQVQLRMTVNIRFVNNKNHTQDFERQFTANTQYDSSQQLNSVQEELVQNMIDDLVDQIFNVTVANW